jgi:DNA-binding phage protein
MEPKLTAFDAADFLDSEEVIAEYLRQVEATGDKALLEAAKADVKRAREAMAGERPAPTNF